MSTLGALLGSGRYVFYKSLYNSSNPIFREAASVASGRINSTNIIMSGRSLDKQIQAESPEFQQFKTMINSYLSQLATIASSMRQNEVSYIKNILVQFRDDKKHTLLKQSELDTLNNISNQEKITLQDYNNLIAALNKIKYNEDRENFTKTIKTQIKNISLAKHNLEVAENQEDIVRAYEERYNTYTGKYNRDITRGGKISYQIGEKIIEEYVSQQRTDLDTLAGKINAVMDALSKNEELIDCIRKEYAKHLEDKQFEIVKDQFISHIIDSAIDEIKEHPRQWSSTTAKNISQNVIHTLSGNNGLQSLLSNSQASKITFKKKVDNTGEAIFKALTKGSKDVAKILMDLDDAEQLIEVLFPENGQTYIKELQSIRSELDRLENQSDKILDERKKNLNRTMKKDFRSSDLGKELAKTLAAGGTLDPQKILSTQTDKFISIAKTQLKDFAVIVKKSSLAELKASQKFKDGLSEVIFNDVGGSFNLKDDVIFAIRTTKVKAPSENEIKADLKSTIEDINQAIQETIGTYLETYYKREIGSEYDDKTGSANTAKARADYEKSMQNLLDRLNKIYESLDSEGQKQLDKYAKETETFLGSISVKEYSLYQDTLGFHGGTLGNTSLKALENIQKMYEQGGISTLDMNTLVFSLLNCSDAAIGGEPVRTSLENYLLGGAALMMFDEGFGEALPYLNTMNDTIKNLLPKNLNLYQLNGAYIPASFVLETIYQNLKQFYEGELNNYTTDFMDRNKVTINNVPEQYAHGANIFDQFEFVSNKVLSMTHIQFLFMAGMLDIFTNLSKAFDVH